MQIHTDQLQWCGIQILWLYLAPLFILCFCGFNPLSGDLRRYAKNMNHKTFSFIGAFLIIGSTFITGILTYALEQDIADFNSKISTINTDLVKAENAYQYSQLSGDLAYIQSTDAGRPGH